MIAGNYDVPVVFVAGDQAIGEQAKSLLGPVETVAVKEGIGGAAINLEGIVRDLANLEGPVVVVLGANAVRDDVAERLGIRTMYLRSSSVYTRRSSGIPVT